MANRHNDDLRTRYQHKSNVLTMRALVSAIAPYSVLVLIGFFLILYTCFKVNFAQGLDLFCKIIFQVS